MLKGTVKWFNESKVLVRGQGAGLVEDGIRNADLAEIVRGTARWLFR